jgi:2-polyprenyl-6-methoxyphenol hydroxylase-like FAD-dependent oxidoreductase
MTIEEGNGVGIIGGGIGGIAAGVALHRAGIGVTVYERASRILEAGAGMMLWPNATRVLRELGVLEQVLPGAGSSTHFLVLSSGGKVLMSIALGLFDVPALCARRADLLAALLAALPADRIRLGHELTHLEQSGSGVRLRFANGATEEHGAAIGADGLRSRVRAQLFGHSDPIYRGYTVWRGVARFNGSAIRRGCNSESWGHGKRFGILGMDPGRFTWYAAANVPEGHVDAPDGRKRELLRMFEGWHEPVTELIEATGDSGILKHGAYDLAPLRHWGAGRVTLLGDAAHPCTPNLGQGGGMAIEDALGLAKCVQTEVSVERALRRYESLRRRRTSHIQRRSLWMGHIGQWEKRLFVLGRGVVTGLLPATPFEHNLRRTYSYEV